MRSWVLAAGLLAAAVTTGAQAADLDEGPPPDRYGSAYDDPRYADIYKYPRGPGYGAPPPRLRRPYAGPPPYAGPIPRERVYRDDEDDDRDYGPRRYSYSEPAPPTPGAARRANWSRSGCSARAGATSMTATCAASIATVRARRPSGRLFELTLDRCSGHVVRAEPLEGRPLRPLCLWAAAAALGPGLLS